MSYAWISQALISYRKSRRKVRREQETVKNVNVFLGFDICLFRVFDGTIAAGGTTKTPDFFLILLETLD